MGIKNLHKVLKVALWMYTIDSPTIVLELIKEMCMKDVLCYLKRGSTQLLPFRIIFKHFLFCKISWSLSHWMCHIQNPYAWFYGQFTFWVEILAQCYLVNSILTLFTLKPNRNFFFCIIKWKHMKKFFRGFLQFVSNAGNYMCQ